MKNIHLLPTDKPSRLYIGNNGNFVFGMIQTSIQSRNDDFTNQNIYITSDEKIKEESYSFYPPFGVGKNIVINRELCFHIESKNGKGSFTQRTYQTLDLNKKIILTTDQDLINDGVQAIDDEFLKWFVKNPSYVEVETYSLGIENEETGESHHYKYEIIIPEEEPKQTIQEYEQQGLEKHSYELEPKQEYIKSKDVVLGYKTSTVAQTLDKLVNKQETLEEVAEKEIPNRIRSTAFGSKFEWEPTKERKAFIRGAKWQAERMYNEEDMYKLMDEYQYYLVNTNEICKTFKELCVKKIKKS